MVSLFRQRHSDSNGQPPDRPLAQVSQNFQASGMNKNTTSARDASPLDAEPERAPIVGILGSKGGVGASTITLNLTAKLAANSERNATLIDANLQQPDICVMLGRQPNYTLSNLIEKTARLDERVIGALAETVDCNQKTMNVFSPSLKLEDGLTTDLNELPECLAKVGRKTDIIVIDLPRQLDRVLMSLLDTCDQILLVAEPSLTSILATRRWLSAFDDLGYDRENLTVIINRAGGRLKHLESEIVSQLGSIDVYRLPNTYRCLEDASLAGEPIVLASPKCPYARAIDNLAVGLKKAMEEKN